MVRNDFGNVAVIQGYLTARRLQVVHEGRGVYTYHRRRSQAHESVPACLLGLEKG